MSKYPDATELYDGKPIDPPACTCYECVGSDIDRMNGGVWVKNNMKHHTLGEPCDECGRPRGKYRNLGRKGYYVCYVCD